MLPCSVKNPGINIQIGIKRPHVILGLKLFNRPIMCLAALTQRYKAIPKRGKPITITIIFVCCSVIILFTHNAKAQPPADCAAVGRSAGATCWALGPGNGT